MAKGAVPAVLFVLFCSVLGKNVLTQQFYVSSNSNSTTNCGTESTPCGTVEAGIRAACSVASYNITVIVWVEPGIYEQPTYLINCPLSLQSTNGSATTTLITNSNQNFFDITTDSDNSTVIVAGFTIQQISPPLQLMTSNCFYAPIIGTLEIHDIQIENCNLRAFVDVSQSSQFTMTDIISKNCSASNFLAIASNNMDISSIQIKNGNFPIFAKLYSLGTISVDNLQISDTGSLSYMVQLLSLSGTLAISNSKFTSLTGAAIHSSTLILCPYSKLKLTNTTFQEILRFESLFESNFGFEISNCNISGVREVTTVFLGSENTTIEDSNIQNLSADKFLVASGQKMNLTISRVTTTNVSCVMMFELDAITGLVLFIDSTFQRTKAANVLALVGNTVSVVISSCEFHGLLVVPPQSFVVPSVIFAQFSHENNFESSQITSEAISSVTIENSSFISCDVSPIRIIKAELTTLSAVEVTSSDSLENVLYLRDTNLVMDNFQIIRCGGSSSLRIEKSNVSISNLSIQEGFYDNYFVSLFRCSGSLENIVLSNITHISQKAFTFDESECIIRNFTGESNFGKFGGSISSYLSNLTLHDSTFSNNSADVGGAIYAESGALYTNNVLVEGCTAISGGAMFLSGDLQQGTIYNTNITRNTATSQGGGIIIAGTSEIILDSVNFRENTALSGGCLITTSKSTPTIKDTLFTKCKSNSSGGGVIASENSISSFRSCVFDDNFASSIASSFLAVEFSCVSFIDTKFLNNFSPNDGGALYATDSSNITIKNTVFMNNTADSTAGAIMFAVNGKAKIENSFFYWNRGASKGGAIATFNNAYIESINTTFEQNSGNSGGAIYGSDSTNQIFRNCSFLNNTAATRGGGMYLSASSTVYFINSLAKNNRAVNAPGGAIFIQDDAYAELIHSEFLLNGATDGGAVYLIGNRSASVQSCKFSYNFVGNNGGAISVGNQATSSWRNCQCDHNIAELNGGCIAANDITITSFYNMSIHNNIAYNGGGLYVDSFSLMDVRESEISKNAANNGAGIFVSRSGSIHCRQSVIQHNTAASNGGGLLFGSSNCAIREVEFINNSANNGGAVFCSYSDTGPLIVNSYMEGNRATSGGAIYYYAVLGLEPPNGTYIYDDIEYIVDMEDNRDLLKSNNLTMIRNSAENGGALFYNSLLSFTPEMDGYILIAENTAGFGGAIYFSEYFQPKTIIYDAQFRDNIASYGGSSVGFHEINEVSAAGNFCSNCSFPSVYPETSGYQNDEGFASVPTNLGFNPKNDPCPGSVTLDASPITIIVFLFDKFGTTVTGQTLIDYPVYVRLNASSSAEITVSNNLSTVQVSPDTGGAEFNETSFCGRNNVSVDLSFLGIFPPAYHFLQSTSCSIIIYGCISGFTVQQSNEAGGCDYCVEENSLNTAVLTLSLLAIIFTLCLMLCIIVTTLSVIRYKKRRQTAMFRAMEIPDFIGKPSVTLEDILTDPAIKRLEWETISILETIGQGASGLVSRGIWCEKGNRKEIALKELRFGFQNFAAEVLEEFLIEIKYMSALYDENIVSFYGICVNPDHSKIYLVTELMHFGSVRDLLDKKQKNLPWSIRLKFAKDAAKGMAYLHEKKLIHRDMKSDNLLVNNEWTCKVADFGISTVKPTITREMTCIGTPVYMAPEVLLRNKYSEKADVFSFGIVLWELFTGKRPYADGDFAAMNQAQLIYLITEKQSRPSLEGLDAGLQQLITDCWNTDPRLRPSFTESIVRLRRLKGGNKNASQDLSWAKNFQEIRDSPSNSQNLDSVNASTEEFDFDAKLHIL